MLEPIMMSKTIFDAMPADQRDLLMAVGSDLEAFGQKGAKEDDLRVEQIFGKAGAKVQQLDEANLRKWRDIARDTAWKDFAAKSETCADLLKMAEQIS